MLHKLGVTYGAWAELLCVELRNHDNAAELTLMDPSVRVCVCSCYAVATWRRVSFFARTARRLRFSQAMRHLIRQTVSLSKSSLGAGPQRWSG